MLLVFPDNNGFIVMRCTQYAPLHGVLGSLGLSGIWHHRQQIELIAQGYTSCNVIVLRNIYYVSKIYVTKQKDISDH